MQFNSRISNASAVIQRLQVDDNNKFLRGPFLANLEIERRKHMHGKGNDENLLRALTDYYVRYILHFDFQSPKFKFYFLFFFIILFISTVQLGASTHSR